MPSTNKNQRNQFWCVSVESLPRKRRCSTLCWCGKQWHGSIRIFSGCWWLPDSSDLAWLSIASIPCRSLHPRWNRAHPLNQNEDFRCVFPTKSFEGSPTALLDDLWQTFGREILQSTFERFPFAMRENDRSIDNGFVYDLKRMRSCGMISFAIDLHLQRFQITF